MLLCRKHLRKYTHSTAKIERTFVQTRLFTMRFTSERQQQEQRREGCKTAD